MKAGGGKRKGAEMERKIAKKLSLWISDGNQSTLLWRSAMSGGRSTVQLKKGIFNVEQAGDICAVHPDGFKLTGRVYIEIKNYKDLQLSKFIFLKKGILQKFWDVTKTNAAIYKRKPLMIIKENNMPELMLANHSDIIYLLQFKDQCPQFIGPNDIWIAKLNDVIKSSRFDPEWHEKLLESMNS